MKYNIEKNVPTPDARSSKYPFRAMVVGDSFYTDDPYVRNAASAHAKRYGRKFKTRREGDGVRVWRTE